jgi:predicted transposase YdaD
MKEKARRDKNMFERWAREEGRQEGSQMEKIEIAKTLLMIRDSIEKIVKVTGLAQEEVENLRDQ